MAYHPQDRFIPEGSKDWSFASSGFAGRMLMALHDNQSQHENSIFSPMCVTLALTAMDCGARGETHRQTTSCMGLGQHLSDHVVTKTHEGTCDIMDKPEGNVEFNVASGIFVDEKFTVDETFRNEVDENLKVQVEECPFRNDPHVAAKRMNDFVKSNTKGKLEGELQPNDFNERTTAVLVNAVHFCGPWEHPFEEKNTRLEPFTLLTKDGTKEEVQVPMMRLQNVQFPVGEHTVQDISFRSLTMPHIGSQFVMTFIIPDQGDRDTLKKLEHITFGRNLPETLDRLTEEQSQRTVTNLHVPRFTIRSEAKDLKRFLKQLGMIRPFTTKADFTGISSVDGQKIHMDKVVHSAVLQVNEQGTGDSKATKAVPAGTPPTEGDLNFYFDRFFLFVLRHVESNAILFAGHVSDPRAA